MVLVRDRTQDDINRILRPHKRRFGKAKKENPREFMQLYAERHLRRYRPRQVCALFCLT